MQVSGHPMQVSGHLAEVSGPVTEGEADDSRPLVLLVEDHPDVRAYLRDQFSAETYRVLEAVDGQAGLEIAQAHVPDLIVTDLMMPRMDGVELTRALKTDPATNHVPIILLTAKANIESRLEGLETGADDYLTKPFQPAELAVRVRNLIENRRRLREKYSQEIRQVVHQVREIKLDAAVVTVQSADDRFIQRALGVVEENLADEAFDVEAFAAAMALSRVQLYRKLKALTDQTPTDFIRTLRLRRAAQLLTQQMGNVAEVAYAVGYQNLSYFAKTFKELHGVAPSEWAAQSPPFPPDSAPPDA
jgi:DNA-binding response OmpR family regulator